jgi:hypothetical protein
MSSIITIPTPCHEDWNNMSPKGQGRHCSSCCKTVVDFTSWQPLEILMHFRSNKNVCGRFTADQLNEPIPTQEDFVKQISYFNISTVKKMAAIFLFAFMIGASSCNDTHTTGEMEETIGLVATVIDSTKNIPTTNTTEIIDVVVPEKRIIDTPPKLLGKPVIHKSPTVEIPSINDQIEIEERQILMGEPAIMDTNTLVNPTCTIPKDKNEHIVMGKPSITRRTENKND